MRPTVLLALLLTATAAHAQWDIEDSHTTASLRGIHNVGGGVAWASGTSGTVLRTEDGGYLWQTCAIPPDAEKLDFRGIQAFDENTAIVMSSGKGDLSRLYKTTDGCKSWKLLFTNPDKEGFWDAIQFSPATDRDKGRIGQLVGDPVDGSFVQFYTYDYGKTWVKGERPTFSQAREGESLFAASNSTLIVTKDNGTIFVTGGKSGSRSRILSEYVKHDPQVSWKYIGKDIPVTAGESAGAFSVATSFNSSETPAPPAEQNFQMIYFPRNAKCVAVGGDYKKPDQAKGTSASSNDGGQHWYPAQTPPHGYRSAVAYDPDHKLWITVGPNGTDLSTDDGKNWHPLQPLKTQPADADKNWNALSLPFVVGPKGRIGKLNTTALPTK